MGKADNRLSKPPVKALVSDAFWVAPIPFRGYLWSLSATGQVYKYSPYSGQPVPVLALGQGFGRCAPVIRQLQDSPASGRTEPWLITTSAKTVKGFSLISGQTRELACSGPGEEILANSIEEYVGVEADLRTVFFLSREGGSLNLASADVHTGVVRRFVLPEGAVSGPFRCDDSTFLYSATQLYSFSEVGMRMHAFPAGFQAWVRQNGRDVKPSFGRVPYMVCGRAVYIPGTYARRSAFLLQRLKGGVGETAVVQAGAEATYRQDRDGRPVLSLPGKIAVLADAGIQEVLADSQLSWRRPAFVSGGLSAGFVETAGGERLRIYSDHRVYDSPLSQFPRFLECMGYFGIGSAFVLAYLTDAEQLGLASWYA